jgi:hypothetical protein
MNASCGWSIAGSTGAPVRYPRRKFYRVLALLFLVAIPALADGYVPKTPQMFGALADGVHDDTEAIQAAIDAANESRGGLVIFPPGTYLISSVDINAGLALSGYGATLKKKGGEAKFSRTFTTQNRKYRGETDSPPLTIKGFQFDGNRAAQGKYDEYELEQQHMIFLQGDAAGPGKLVAIVEDCHFRNGVADGVSVYNNVAASISNCRATDVFRGGIVVTGGHSEVHINNFTAGGIEHVTGIDVEVDGPGYGDSFRTDITATNLLLAGDFDISIRDGSTFHGTNIMSKSAPFYVQSRDSTVKISNSTFGVGVFSAYKNRIVFPHDVSFSHCTFVAGVAEPEEGVAAAHVYWNISGTDHQGQRLRFLDCDFRISATTPGNTESYALYLEADRVEQNNRLTVRNCRIESGFDHGVFMRQGGQAAISDTEINAATGLHLGAATAYPLDVRVEGVRFGTEVDVTTHINAAIPESRIEHRDVYLSADENTLSTGYGLAGNTYVGGRTISGVEPPVDVPGLTGDLYRLRSPLRGEIYTWFCTRADATSATWLPVERIP